MVAKMVAYRFVKTENSGDCASSLLGPHDPPPFRVIPGKPSTPFLITCDHAGCALPSALGDLGLSASDLERHIAWDIGAAAIAERLARELNSVSILQTYSRLVIDCNRHLGVDSSIALTSESTPIPGNIGLCQRDVEGRIKAVFLPYHAWIRAELDRRAREQIRTVYVAMHSFTPCYLGTHRPWHVGVLYGKDARFASQVLSLLREETNLVVGDNQPYVVTEYSDYGVNEHAEGRKLPYVELEVRQDLISDAVGQREWTERLARILSTALHRMDGSVG
jgi:predicted N-formylglutamate amidohydrolase